MPAEVKSVVRRIVSLLLAFLITGLSLLSSCNMAGGGSDDSGSGVPEATVETAMAFFAVPRSIVESNEENPVDDAYATGMTVSGTPETGITASVSNCVPYPDIPVCVNGSVTVTGEDLGTTFAIRFVGSVTFDNASYSSGSIDAEMVMPSSNGEPDMNAEPLELNGTVTLDGSSWGFQELVDAIEEYAQTYNLPDLTYPYRAHYVAAGPPTEHNGVSRGTVCFSQDGTAWGVLHVSGRVEFFGIAANENGNLVAVGADRWWGIPDGKGYIYYSERGDQWELVETTPEGEGLFRVAYGNGTWVTVGNGGSVYYSSDGESWSSTTITGEPVLRDVAYGNGSWVVIGENGTWIETSAPSSGWTSVTTPDSSSVRGVVYDADGALWRGSVPDFLDTGDTETLLWEWSGSGDVTDITGESNGFRESLDDISGEPWAYTAWDDGSITHHFILSTLEGDGRIFQHSGSSWSMQGLVTSHDTPLVGVACGPYHSGGTPRWVLASGGGDIWVSDDSGDSWYRVKQDYYGIGAITYRDWQ